MTTTPGSVKKFTAEVTALAPDARVPDRTEGRAQVTDEWAVHPARADKLFTLFTRLRPARLNKTFDAEIRQIARTEVLILDDCPHHSTRLRPATSTSSSSSGSAGHSRS